MKKKTAVFWFRRDLRLHDNHGLYQALKEKEEVLPIFIFETVVPGTHYINLGVQGGFLYSEVQRLKQKLEEGGSSLWICYNTPVDAFKYLLKDFNITSVYANKEYEPYTRKRDTEVKDFLRLKGIDLYLFKDHVIFEENEILNSSSQPYTVFTPYSRKWRAVSNINPINYFPSEKLKQKFLCIKPFPLPKKEKMRITGNNFSASPPEISEDVIRNYDQTRNFPFIQGTSRLGVHLRFGTISIRELSVKVITMSDIFLNELIWRNFFSTIMWHFPQLTEKSFQPKYDRIQWRNNEEEFERWCQGETGYPMVDAGMRELNATGFMHNRVRMITAGFLTKHLLIDWRWGETYFAEKLIDFELASNNGNWQWAAGTGCDSVPWFRIFNPEIQQKKFDPKGIYIRRWITEFGTSRYPKPVVEHKFARLRALQVYKSAFL